MRPRRRGRAAALRRALLGSFLAAVLRLAAAHVCTHDAQPAHAAVAAGERHAQRYEAHPFAALLSEGAPQASPAAQRRLTARRLAQANGTQPYAARAGALGPLRVALEWRGDGGSNASAAVSPLVQAWLRHALVPAAAAWWRAALQVWPVSGALTLAAPVSCSPLPSDVPMAGPWAAADVALRVYLAPYPSSGPGAAPPATPDACSTAANVCSSNSQACAATTRACVAAGGEATAPQCTQAALACDAAREACAAAAELCDAARGAQRVVPVSAIAFASTCARDQYDRPVAGVLTYVPSFLVANAAALAAATAWAATPAGGAAAAAPDAAASAPDVAAASALLAAFMRPDAAAKQLLYVTMHEIGHALGFSAASIPLFRDGATGLPRAPRVGGGAFGVPAAGGTLPASMLALPAERGHAKCGNASGSCVYKLRTPAAVAAASRHFGCPADRLLGPELENEEAETRSATATQAGPSSYGSHWEQRLFASELMAPVLQFDEMFVSEVTLAFFEDSGWYWPDYAQAVATSAGPGVRWGVAQGCDFALRECLRQRTGPAADAEFAAAAQGDPVELARALQPAGSPAHFCSARREALCTFDLRDKGTCGIESMGTAAAAMDYYAYFRNVPFALAAQRQYGGRLPHADYCPMVLPVESCTADPGGGANAAGEVFGAASRCLMSTLAPAVRVNGTGGVARAAAAPGCYSTACSADGLTVVLSAKSPLDGVVRRVSCLAAQEGVAIPVPGFAGALTCPPVWAVCGRSPEPCDAAAASLGLSGTTLALGLAAAAAGAFAILIYTPPRLAAAWHAGAAAREEARAEAAERARVAAAAVEAEAEAMRTAFAFRGGDGRGQPPPPPRPGAWGGAEEEETPPQQQQQQRWRRAPPPGEENPFGVDDMEDGAHPTPPPASPPPPPPQQLDAAAEGPPKLNFGCLLCLGIVLTPLGAWAGTLLLYGCDTGCYVLSHVFGHRPRPGFKAPPPWAVLSRSHPLAVLCRSVVYAISRGARHLQPGAPVQVQMYEQTRGWGAAAVVLRLTETAAGGGARPLPPPPELPPGAGWEPRLARQRHPASFVVARVAADARGAPMYCLQAYDFDAPGGAARALRVQRLWGGAAGPPPPLPAGLDDNSADVGSAAAAAAPPPPRFGAEGNAFGAPNADGAFRAMGSAGAGPGGAYGGGAYAGGYGSGVSAAAAEAVTGWTPWFYREQLHAPPLAAVPPERRPPAALRAGFGGSPLRRALALALLHGPVCLLLVALEASLRGAALQARCAPAWRVILARAASAGALTACFAYACACAARAAPHLGIEMLPRRAFWPPLGVAFAGALAAATWAVSATYTAASGGLPLPMGPAATAPPGAAALVGLCADPAGPVACAEAALRRVGIAWGSAIAADAFLFSPLLLLASAYVWRDDVAVDTWEERGEASDAHQKAPPAEAWGAPAEVEMPPRASPQPPRRAQQEEADAGGAWGGGGGGGAWGEGDDDDEATPPPVPVRTWRNPTYDDAAPSAPPLPPLTRGAALRAETTGAWG